MLRMMPTSRGSLWLLVAFLLVTLAARPSFAQRVGGFRDVPVDDKQLVAAAKFAVEAREKESKEKTELVKILKGGAQVVAGMNYRIDLDVKVEGGVRTAQAIVWAKLDRTFQLTKWEWQGAARTEAAGPTVASSEARPFPGKASQWNGLQRYDFEHEGTTAIVVVPEKPLAGRPWVWRGEFFGAFPNADIELVKNGWHLAYVGVPNLFGAPKAMTAWEKFHARLVKEHGLHPRPGLIGLSRGALYCMAWAAAHPDHTLAVYLDAGVCDFKSWPGGKLKGWGVGQGSAGEWQNVLKAFDFKNDEEAVAYKGNPVDHLAPLAKAKLPLLLVYGDADKVVPHQENSEIVYERYRALGGPVERIVKPGVDHHPHGLTDPAPILEFFNKAWQATSKNTTP